MGLWCTRGQSSVYFGWVRVRVSSIHCEKHNNVEHPRDATVSQGRQTDRSTLKPSSLPSVKVNYWKIAVGHGVKVPSPDIFALEPIKPVNPFRAPKPLPILNPSNFVPKNGFPVVKGLIELFK